MFAVVAAAVLAAAVLAAGYDYPSLLLYSFSFKNSFSGLLKTAPTRLELAGDGRMHAIFALLTRIINEISRWEGFSH
jgi:hypothetical protein